MTGRAPRLPPLNSLRVFQAVVRHGSFRAAADELLVSPQAVSQQIKLLEDSLGITLFMRKGRSVLPNEQAILLAHHVHAGFAEFAEGVRRVSKPALRERINLNVSPYFATRYLLPRLDRFREILSATDLRLTTMVELPDFEADDVDVAVQWGYGAWPDYEQILLLRDHKVICCTPALAERLKAPGDLAGMTLLHPVLANRLWSDILGHLGVEASGPAREVQFHDAATMRRATLAGMGVGLVSMIDAAEDLAAGRLVAPFGGRMMQDMPQEQVPGFYLVMPRAHRRVKAIASFVNWVTSENWTEADPAGGANVPPSAEGGAAG